MRHTIHLSAHQLWPFGCYMFPLEAILQIGSIWASQSGLRSLEKLIHILTLIFFNALKLLRVFHKIAHWAYFKIIIHTLGNYNSRTDHITLVEGKTRILVILMLCYQLYQSCVTTSWRKTLLSDKNRQKVTVAALYYVFHIVIFCNLDCQYTVSKLL